MTYQARDTLFINNVRFNVSPINVINDYRKKERESDIEWSSNLLRGYTSKWAIREDKLFLYHNEELIFAEWVNQILGVDLGKCVGEYSVAYSTPIYEFTVSFKIENGVIKNSSLFDNLKKYRDDDCFHYEEGSKGNTLYAYRKTIKFHFNSIFIKVARFDMRHRSIGNDSHGKICIMVNSNYMNNFPKWVDNLKKRRSSLFLNVAIIERDSVPEGKAILIKIYKFKEHNSLLLTNEDMEIFMDKMKNNVFF